MLPIILAINNEDDRAYVEKIYNQYGKKIYKIAFNILNNEEDSEDCLHDVVKIIIDNLEMFQALEGEQLIKLLVTCSRNAALNIYRKNKIKHINERQRKSYTDDETDEKGLDIESVSDDGMFVDLIVINEESRKRISEMIEDLDPIYKDVLYLRYQYSMKNQDIAKLLKVSESVVKVRYHRAKKILFQKRGKELDEMRKNG